MTAEPCPTCGQTRPGRHRVALGGAFRCNVCERRAYYLANREALLAKQDAYAAAHREQEAARARSWREAHPGSTLIANRRDPDAYRAWERAYRNRRQAEYRAANPLPPPMTPEQRKASANAAGRRWYATHREQALAAARAYRLREVERRAEYAKRWAAANPRTYHDRSVRERHKRRARLLSCEVMVVTSRDLDRVRSQPCLACGSRERIQVDHLLPLARGGRHAVGNLIPLCFRCNPAKGPLTWAEWRWSGTPRARLVFG